MTVVLAVVGLRLLLSGVFLTAAAGKLLDLTGTRFALEAFGVPAVLASPLGVALPFVELVAAIALLGGGLAPWGAALAGVLLLAFIGGIAASLARGKKPDCHCFGQLHSTPAGWSTLIRNAALAGVAGLILAAGSTRAGPSIWPWLADRAPERGVSVMAWLTLGLVVAGGVWALVELTRQQGRLLVRIEHLESMVGSRDHHSTPHEQGPTGLPVGSPAPSFELADVDGTTWTLDSLLAQQQPVLLVFSHAGCGPCRALMPEVARWQRECDHDLTVAIVAERDPEANRQLARQYGIARLLLQIDREVTSAYQTHGTPSAVLVRADGMIGEPLAQGAEAIRHLVGQTLGGSTSWAVEDLNF